MEISLSKNCLAAFILLAIISCKSFREPEFRRMDNVRMGQVGLKESNLLADLYYYNLNKSRLIVKYAEGDAWIEETYLGRFSMDTLIRILPLSEFRLPINLKIDMNTLFRNMSIILLKGKEAMIRVEGKARVGKAGIFLNYPIRYMGKHDLTELMKPGL